MCVFESFIFGDDITSSITHKVQIQFSSKMAEIILQKEVENWSRSFFASKSQVGSAEFNEKGLQKNHFDTM